MARTSRSGGMASVWSVTTLRPSLSTVTRSEIAAISAMRCDT